jgi:hypothetical protein
LLAFSIVALVFVAGFLLGRFAGIGPAGEPTVHGLAPADPLNLTNVSGSVAYSLWSDTDESLTTIAQHDIVRGDVEPLARFSAWAAPINTHLVSYGRSVALIASDGMNSYVAFVAAGSPASGWVPGVEAAWTSEHEVYVREKDGTVTKWSASSAHAPTTTALRARRIFQTPSGVVAQTERGLEALGSSKVLAAPSGARVLAVAPGTDRALVDHNGPTLWDGKRFVPVRVEGYEVLAGSFEDSGERVAMTLKKDGVLTVAVVDRDGNAALKPLGVADRACAATPAWDAAGHWLYVAPGNGSLYAIESAGPEIRRVQTHSVGCGLAWLAA